MNKFDSYTSDPSSSSFPSRGSGRSWTYFDRQHGRHRDILREAKRTVPLGVEVYRPDHYMFPLPEGNFHLLVLKAWVPPEKEGAVAEWEKRFEGAHNISVIVDRSRAYSGINDDLRKFAGGGDFLDRTHLPVIQRAIQSYFGTPPPIAPLIERATAETLALKDMTSIPFIALDAESVRDREDLVHCESISGTTTYRLRVAIIDVTTFVSPNSPFDEYARSIGKSIYGSSMIVPTLGTEAAFGLASFNRGEVRPAYVVEMIVDERRGVIRSSVCRAKVVNHHSIAPDELDSPEAKSAADIIEALRGASSALRISRARRARALRIDRDDPGGDIVAECMIASKTALATFMAASGIPTAFKTHARMSAARVREFIQKAHDLGVPAASYDFRRPARMAQLFTDLEAANAHSLLSEIIDVYLPRSRFDLRNYGHAAVGGPYMEPKPRESMGIQDQFQLRAATDPAGWTPLTREELWRRIEFRNKQREEQESREFKFRSLERMQEALGRTGDRFSGVAAEIHGRQSLVDFPEFQLWGLVNMPSGAAPQPGDKVTASLLRYSIPHKRYEFSQFASRC